MSTDLPYLKAEIVYAATHEGAQSVDDVLSRRTRIAFEASDGGDSIAQAVATLLEPILGWDEAAKKAKDALDALILFKGDMGAYCRLYSFLSQVFNYGNTDIEKRFLFYKHLVRLLDFGRERDIVDLSQIVLTHHAVNSDASCKSSISWLYVDI